MAKTRAKSVLTVLKEKNAALTTENAQLKELGNALAAEKEELKKACEDICNARCQDLNEKEELRAQLRERVPEAAKVIHCQESKQPILSKVRLCHLCEREGWIRHTGVQTTSFDGKAWKSFDGVAMVTRNIGNLCAECHTRFTDTIAK